MNLADLRKQTHTKEPLTPELWAEALILGKARTLVRDKDRRENRDRGSARKNSDIDLRGAMGELLLYAAVERCEGHEAALAHMRHHLFVHDGPAPADSEPDLDFENEAEGGRCIRIDAKTFDCSLQQPDDPTRSPYLNRMFAINKKKHDGLRRHCEHYYCGLFGRFGRQAAISRLVDYGDVETNIVIPPFRWKDGPPARWFICDVAGRGDPSHNLLVTAFIDQHFERAARPDLQDLRRHSYSKDDIRSALASKACWDSVVSKAPQLPAVLPEVREALGVQPQRG